jgi:hypothetical protein
MSLRLEAHGVYLLPNALEGGHYVILHALQDGDGWRLVETHAVPFGLDYLQQRATLPPEEMLSYAVDAEGRLVQQTPAAASDDSSFTVGNLSILGHLQNDTFIPAPEGL